MVAAWVLRQACPVLAALGLFDGTRKVKSGGDGVGVRDMSYFKVQNVQTRHLTLRICRQRDTTFAELS